MIPHRKNWSLIIILIKSGTSVNFFGHKMENTTLKKFTLTSNKKKLLTGSLKIKH